MLRSSLGLEYSASRVRLPVSLGMIEHENV
jgi:hypothetical protein